MTERTCLECAKTFPQRPKVRPMSFCSPKCRRRYERKHPPRGKFVPATLVCSVCTKTFVQNTRLQRYCGHDCYVKAWPINNREKHNARVRRHKKEHPEWYVERTPRYSKNHRAKVVSMKPWKYMLQSRRLDAANKQLPFDLTDEWCAARWKNRCELTNIEFVITGRPGPNPFSGSLDRIKPELGYIQSNCRFILFGCNGAKGSGTDEDLYKIAEALMRNKPTACHTDLSPDQSEPPANKIEPASHTAPT